MGLLSKFRYKRTAAGADNRPFHIRVLDAAGVIEEDFKAAEAENKESFLTDFVDKYAAEQTTAIKAELESEKGKASSLQAKLTAAETSVSNYKKALIDAGLPEASEGLTAAIDAKVKKGVSDGLAQATAARGLDKPIANSTAKSDSDKLEDRLQGVTDAREQSAITLKWTADMREKYGVNVNRN